MRQELIGLWELGYPEDLSSAEVVELELFDPMLLILHPEDSSPIKIKRDRDLRQIEVLVLRDLVSEEIHLVQGILLPIQLVLCVTNRVRMVSFFWVGYAQNITSFSLFRKDIE